MPLLLTVEDHAHLAEILATFVRMQEHLEVAAVVRCPTGAAKLLWNNCTSWWSIWCWSTLRCPA